GMKTVQLFNREQRNARRFDELNLDLLEANIEQVRWFSLFHPTVQLTSAVATGLILFYAGSRLIGDPFTDVVTIGMLVAYIQYSQMFFRPLQDRKSTRLNSSHVKISYAVFCLKKKNNTRTVHHDCK